MESGDTKIEIQLKRAYEPSAKTDGYRVLVERLWPRGVSKETLKIDLWAKALSPSTELRKWFSHDPDKWPEFRRRYFKELSTQSEGVKAIVEKVANGRVTFVFASREETYNNAAALKEYVENLANV